jgi:DNA-binding NarL/FixJ family response regulator
MLSDIKLIKKLIKIGANGYLLKNSGQQEIITAINDVMADRTHFDQRIMEMLLKSGNETKTKSNYLPSLSRREKEILGLIIKEHTTNEIAEKLFISSGTVESHRRNMISKLGVRNTAGLVSVAYEYGLLDG